MKHLFIVLVVIIPHLLGAFNVVGHRGASAYAPENTLESILLAYEQGALLAECDILLTKDNKLVLMHDDKLLRTGGLDKMVSLATYQEIRQLDVGSWKGDTWANTRVPLLTDVVKAIPDGKLLFVEIKAGDKNQGVSDALQNALFDFIENTPPPYLEKLIFISFDHEILKRLKFFFSKLHIVPILTHKEASGHWPKVERLSDIDDYIVLSKQHGFLGLFLEYGDYLSKPIIDRIHAQGLLVAVWNYQEDDTVENAQKMRAFGVDFYNTNDIVAFNTSQGCKVGEQTLYLSCSNR